MIRLHFNSVTTSFKVVALVFKALNNRYEFFVRSYVVKLSALKLLKIESNKVLLLSVFL